MGKKKRVIAYTGSLISPLFRYITQADFRVNLMDKKGASLASLLHNQAMTTPQQYKQPNFNATYEYTDKTPASYMDIKFLNGWSEKLYLHQANVEEISYILQRHNKVLEGVRNFQGYDDQIEDEVREL